MGIMRKLKLLLGSLFVDTLDKIAEGAKEAVKGATGEDKIVAAPKEGQDFIPGEAVSVNSLVKGIKK